MNTENNYLPIHQSHYVQYRFTLYNIFIFDYRMYTNNTHIETIIYLVLTVITIISKLH